MNINGLNAKFVEQLKPMTLVFSFTSLVIISGVKMLNLVKPDNVSLSCVSLVIIHYIHGCSIQ